MLNVNLDSSTTEIEEHKKRIKVLQAKIKSKQKAIVKAINKLRKSEAESKTLVKCNTLIGQLKLKIINMQTQSSKFKPASSPAISNYSSKKVNESIQENKRQNSPMKLALKDDYKEESSAERLKMKQDALLNALRSTGSRVQISNSVQESHPVLDKNNSDINILDN